MPRKLTDVLIKEILTKAIEGVVNQGRKSVNNVGHCVYRGKDNTCCAVGFLISDEHYNKPLMEGQGAFSPPVTKGVCLTWDLQEGTEEVDRLVNYLNCLQCCHDKSSSVQDHFVDNFIERLEEFVNRIQLPAYVVQIATNAKENKTNA